MEFFKFLKMQLLQLSKNHKIIKIRKSGQNWHFYPSIKQIITLEIVINSLTFVIKKFLAMLFRLLVFHHEMILKPGLHIAVMVVSTIVNMFLTLFQAVLIHDRHCNQLFNFFQL